MFESNHKNLHHRKKDSQNICVWRQCALPEVPFLFGQSLEPVNALTFNPLNHHSQPQHPTFSLCSERETTTKKTIILMLLILISQNPCCRLSNWCTRLLPFVFCAYTKQKLQSHCIQWLCSHWIRHISLKRHIYGYSQDAICRLSNDLRNSHGSRRLQTAPLCLLAIVTQSRQLGCAMTFLWHLAELFGSKSCKSLTASPQTSTLSIILSSPYNKVD